MTDGTLSDLAPLVARTRAAFDDGRTRNLEWRHRQLDGLARMLVEEESALTRAMRSDLGKPAFEGWATDLGIVGREIRHIRKHLGRHLRARRVRMPLLATPGRAEIRLEPLGVVLVLAPWNYPVNLAVSPLAAALAAGNTAIVKPSEHAPATSEALATLVPRHVDDQAVAVVQGGADVAEALLRERFDHIFYTGGGAVGRSVMAAAAAHLTPVTLELGGKSPAIVDASADLEVTARRIVQGKLINAGQTCIAPDHVLVSHARRDELVEAIVASIERMYGSEPATSADYGRIVSPAHLDRLTALVHEPGSGTVVAGGATDPATRYMAPTVLVDTDPDSAIMREEIFGPVLPVIGLADTEEAIRFVNSRPKPLVVYLFADDPAVVDDVVARTSSGAVAVNQTMVHAGIPGLPFGGVGASGTGRYRGLAGVDRLSNPKSVLRRPARPDPPIAYPPYTRVRRALLRRIIGPVIGAPVSAGRRRFPRKRGR
jgi:aldehyde dehydrogenase (NAD+)